MIQKLLTVKISKKEDSTVILKNILHAPPSMIQPLAILPSLTQRPDGDLPSPPVLSPLCRDIVGLGHFMSCHGYKMIMVEFFIFMIVQNERSRVNAITAMLCRNFLARSPSLPGSASGYVLAVPQCARQAVIANVVLVQPSQTKLRCCRWSSPAGRRHLHSS